MIHDQKAPRTCIHLKGESEVLPTQCTEFLVMNTPLAALSHVRRTY